MAETPEWAIKLRDEVCDAYGVEKPPLQFWNSSKPYTTGRTKFTRLTGTTTQIVVTPGADGYAHDVLLHELAHHVAPKGDHHSARFWATAFDLYEMFGSRDVEQFIVREFSYRQGSHAEASRRPRYRGIARAWLERKADQAQLAYAASSVGSGFRVGAQVRLVEGQLRGATGQLARVVEVKYTRALVELEEPIGRFPAGARVLAPMRCMEVVS